MKWLILALVVMPILGVIPMIGLLVQPWGAWYIAGQNMQPPVMIGDPPAMPIDPRDLSPGQVVSDAQRFQLARQAGWTLEQAIIAVAISIAENGSGNPATMSGRNSNGTYDLGLWQINSAHWPQYGGQQALTDPWRNAQAAFSIYGRQNWCAWSTYLVSCGPGHTGSYASYLARAQAASRVQSDPRQA